jgi:hypothetical protein
MAHPVKRFMIASLGYPSVRRFDGTRETFVYTQKCRL